MKSFLIASLLFAATLFTVLAVSGYSISNKIQTGNTNNPVPVEITQTDKRPKVELVFALDTTGSMSGLINAAKEKIWSIASTMAQAQPAPEIKIGLVAYRDRGDVYITKTIALSSDLDTVYSQLLDFKAEGGGDGPESVNTALYQAVNAMQWSEDFDAYKAIFLVGDAPAHHDYPDDIPFHRSIAIAKQKGIVVNAIQAGNDPSTKREWQQIAALGLGDSFKVEQNGSAFAVNTPFDKDIARASERLDKTRMYYGSKEERQKREQAVLRSERVYAEASPASQARRAKFNTSGSGVAFQVENKELMQALESGSISYEDISEDELPDQLVIVGSRIRKEIIEEKLEERKTAKAELKVLADKRDAYIAEQKAKLKDAPATLDEQLLGTLKKQAEKKGLKYEKDNDY
ncbi:MAG: VWA domain-containing protein [Kangiellaceae bacterium]|nr:VWA domain-containing protein [Kangiellaceae bacterium]MCW8999196.1 VWA domain-containing protein [Kangiellaceae bacterium]